MTASRSVSRSIRASLLVSTLAGCQTPGLLPPPPPEEVRARLGAVGALQAVGAVRGDETVGMSAFTIALERAAERIVVLEVARTPVMRRWYIVYRADKRLLPVPAAFDEFVREEGAARIAGYLGDHARGPRKTKRRG